MTTSPASRARRALSRAPRLLAVFAVAVGVLTLGAGSAAVASTPPSIPAASVPTAAGDLEGPQFYSGVDIDVSGRVDGDVYAAGQSVTISGDVTGDVIAAAQTITITGTVGGNVRLAAQNVTVTGTVTRSGTVFAADLTVGGSGSFGDDVVGAVNTMTVGGDIGRDLRVSVGQLTIDGSVGGSVIYISDTDARIAEGAVDGSVERIASSQNADVEVSPWVLFAGWLMGLLYALVALSLITLFAGLLVPRLLQRVTDRLVPSPWRALLVGFVASVAVPAAILLLLTTIVGAPLALAVLLTWVAMTLATFPFGAYYLGRLVLRGNRHPVLKALVGGAILIAALHVPWLSILVWLAMVFFGLGAQLIEIHSRRPWRAASDSGVPSPQPVAPAPATE